MANRRCWLEHQGERVAVQERRQNEWHAVGYQGAVAKAHPCPERTPRTPLPQQSSSSAREEEVRWVLMEDRRRRIVAFVNLAKEMHRDLENSEEVKVGIMEIQEHLGVPVQIGTTLQQVAQQAENEIGQKVYEFFWQQEEVCRASRAR